MKNVFIAAIIACISTACVSSARLETLERRNAELADENMRFRQGYAGTRQDVAPQGAGATQGGQSSTGTAWAYQRHGVYVGTVGAQSRQVTQGRKIRLDNRVCDSGSSDIWSNCGDADDNGSPDLNTWLAFEIDGQPVVCDSGFVHPESRISLLPPGQSCFVEIGRNRTVTLTIKAYRNSGTPTYVMLDSTPYASSYKTVAVGNRNVVAYNIDERSF
jgi:hypothetical protein